MPEENLAVNLPPGGPFAFHEDMRALLVVDMQNACFTEARPRLDRPGVCERINALVRAIRPAGPVVWIQHTDPAEGFPRGGEGWQLLPELEVAAFDLHVEKEGCDSFLETALDGLLRERGVDEVVICGCATDFCVDTTVRAAGSHGYRVIVASDAHTTADRPHADAATVIRHHNYVWADFLLPRGAKISVLPTAEILAGS